MKFSALIFALFFAYVTSAQAEVTQTTTTLEKTKIVTVYTPYTVYNGCITTEVHVSVYGTSDAATSKVSVYATDYDACTGMFVMTYVGDGTVSASYATLKAKKAVQLQAIIHGTAYTSDGSNAPAAIVVELDLAKDPKIWSKDKYNNVYHDACGTGDVKTDNTATGMSGLLSMRINGTDVMAANISATMQFTSMTAKKVSNCIVDSGKG